MKKRYIFVGIFIGIYSIAGLPVYLEIQNAEGIIGSVLTRIGVAAGLSAVLMIIYERYKKKVLNKKESNQIQI